MSKIKLPRPWIAILLALVCALALTFLCVWAFVPIIGAGGCPFWMDPVNFSKTLTLHSADWRIVCMDGRGNIYPLQIGWLMNALVCFVPILSVLLIILFILFWSQKKPRARARGRILVVTNDSAPRHSGFTSLRSTQ